MRIQTSERLTDQPILPTLITLSWPIILGEAMQLMYNLADTFWLGRLGAEQLAAITVSFPLIFIVFSVGAGFAISGVALVSQYTGAGDEENANLAAGQILLFSVIISSLLACIGQVFGYRLLGLVGAGPEIMPYAWAYFRIITAGIPLIFIYFIFSATLQGVGDTITPMKLKMGSVAANIVLDPFLIFGWWVFPALGISGAALATILTRFGATAVGIYMLVAGTKGIRVRARHLRPNWKMLKKILRIGCPAALGDSGLALAITVLTSIVAGFGTFGLAAWGVGNRITSMIRMPAMGLGRATGVLVGQHLGADQPDEAGRTAWLGAGAVFGFMLLLAMLLLMVSPYLMMAFTDEAAVIRLGTDYLRIAGFAFSFLGVQMVLSGALQGAGKTVEQTFFSLFALWGLQIPFCRILAYNLGWGEDGIWWGIFLAKLLGALAITIWFTRGTWKTKVIEDRKEVRPMAG